MTMDKTHGPHLKIKEKNMKLNLLFLAMDLLTLVAYPVVFILYKLRQVSGPNPK
jgi:hypothetical protein